MKDIISQFKVLELRTGKDKLHAKLKRFNKKRIAMMLLFRRF